MERIEGPLNGFYIATLALPMGEVGEEFIGSVRVTDVRPRSYFDCAPLFEAEVPQRVSTEEGAHLQAQWLALQSFPMLAGAARTPTPRADAC